MTVLHSFSSQNISKAIVHTHTHTHTHMHTHMHTHTHAHTHAYTHTHMHTHTHAYTHMHTHAHINTYTHTILHILPPPPFLISKTPEFPVRRWKWCRCWRWAPRSCFRLSSCWATPKKLWCHWLEVASATVLLLLTRALLPQGGIW